MNATTREIERQIRIAETLSYVPTGTQYLVCPRCGTVRPMLPHLMPLAAGDVCGMILGGTEVACGGILVPVKR